MVQSPHDPFDDAVLDLIDHSPTGAVPSTPSYQDALRRLYAARQVFPSADHKDGHVTARSLAGQPAFQAGNLDELAMGTIGPESLESNVSIFDRYVQSLPAQRRASAESHRARAVGRTIHHRPGHGPAGGHDPVHSLILIPGAGPAPGLPGNYLCGQIYEVEAARPAWSILLRDSLDSAAQFDAPSLPEAVAKLREVVESCPFDLRELEALGFRLT